MAKTKNIEKEKNDLLKDLLCAVVAEDILGVDKMGKIYLNKELIRDDEIRMLQAEAKFLNNSRLWSILTNTLYLQAQKTMFELATSFDDMRQGKAILYAIDVQKKIIKIIDGQKFDPLPQPVVKYKERNTL